MFKLAITIIGIAIVVAIAIWYPNRTVAFTSKANGTFAMNWGHIVNHGSLGFAIHDLTFTQISGDIFSYVCAGEQTGHRRTLDPTFGTGAQISLIGPPGYPSSSYKLQWNHALNAWMCTTSPNNMYFSEQNCVSLTQSQH